MAKRKPDEITKKLHKLLDKYEEIENQKSINSEISECLAEVRNTNGHGRERALS